MFWGASPPSVTAGSQHCCNPAARSSQTSATPLAKLMQMSRMRSQAPRTRTAMEERSSSVPHNLPERNCASKCRLIAAALMFAAAAALSNCERCNRSNDSPLSRSMTRQRREQSDASGTEPATAVAAATAGMAGCASSIGRGMATLAPNLGSSQTQSQTVAQFHREAQRFPARRSTCGVGCRWRGEGSEQLDWGCLHAVAAGPVHAGVPCKNAAASGYRLKSASWRRDTAP
eukprot:scaffold144953_cov30-Tisochrysis_lutea.AAC.2